MNSFLDPYLSSITLVPVRNRTRLLRFILPTLKEAFTEGEQSIRSSLIGYTSYLIGSYDEADITSDTQSKSSTVNQDWK